MKLTDELDALLRRFNVVPIRWMYSSGDCMSECMPSERPSALCYMDNACNAIYHQQQEIEMLKTICAEAYQVVGVLADEAGRFGGDANDDIVKILDNLSQQRLVHTDVLPFPSKEQQ